MYYEEIHLKDKFPFLGENGRDPVLQVYVQDNLGREMTHIAQRFAKRPGMLVCPGGGYHRVSLREAEPIAMHFLPEGFHTFVLTYSTGSEARFPVQLREVAAAMELIHENAEAWCCDPERIAIIGFSAGGHLAAHYSNSYNCPQVREVFPQSKKVNASVLCYPVISSDPCYSHGGSFQNLVGYFPLNEADRQVFSCENLVSEDTPPTFLWHTAEDNVVPVQNSLLYAAELAKYKVPFALHIYPYGCHGKSTADMQTCETIQPGTKYLHLWLTELKNWLKEIFHTE